MGRGVVAAAMVLGMASAATAQRPPEGAAPLAPAEVILTPKGVDEVVLDTTFRFALDFNSRTPDRRRNARIVGVAQTFLPELAPLVYRVRVPTEPDRARARLREGVTAFLEGYVGLLIKQGVHDIELRKSESIMQYLNGPGVLSRCNEIPCSQPPCCEQCKAPSGDPPTCQ